MRGIPYYNFPAFDKVAAMLRGQGCLVWSPADADREVGFDAMKLPADTDWNQIPPQFDFQECVTRDITAIRHSTDVFMLAGWESSVGARAEHALAEWLGLQISYEWPETETSGTGTAPCAAPATGSIRRFPSGATRDTDADKLDYEGFSHPLIERRFAEYMHKHRRQPDGALRDSDNWQRGIPLDTYMKSGFRHFMDWWAVHRGCKQEADAEDALCALRFNAMGYLLELLVAHGKNAKPEQMMGNGV
jgi:hypothetical protein